MRKIAMLAAAALSFGAAAARADTPQEEANKKVVVAFYNASLNEKNWAKTLTFIGNRYVQHNPNATLELFVALGVDQPMSAGAVGGPQGADLRATADRIAFVPEGDVTFGERPCRHGFLLVARRVRRDGDR